MLNGRYGRVQESYLRDLGVRGDESKLYRAKIELQRHSSTCMILKFTVN